MGIMKIIPTWLALALLSLTLQAAENAQWPSYRGSFASGISTSGDGPLKWDLATNSNVLWSSEIPGLGLSSPVIWDDHIFLTTAVAQEGGKAELKVGLYGDIESSGDDGPQSWQVICLDKASGNIRWTREVHQGVPKTRRHTKSSHANPTVAVDGKHVVAFFGSEGLYCLDFDGKVLWSKSFGVLDSGYFRMPAAQWGFASSPVIHDDYVIVQCDVQKDSFVAALDLETGEVAWRTPRNEVPTWSTPAILERPDKPTQIILNGYRHIGAYDFLTGEEIWKFAGGGDIPVPTPIFAHDLIYITNAHGKMSPIYAIYMDAKGELNPENDDPHIAWWKRRGGNYMQTPIIVGDLLFACSDMGVLSCYDAKTGDRFYRERLRQAKRGFGFSSSPVSDGKKLYFCSENGVVFVVAAEKTFRILAENTLGETTSMATPALSQGRLYVRTRDNLHAFGESP